MNIVQVEVANILQFQLTELPCGQKNRLYRQLETPNQFIFLTTLLIPWFPLKMFEISSQSGLTTKFNSYSVAVKTILQAKVFGVRNRYLKFEGQNNIWK